MLHQHPHLLGTLRGRAMHTILPSRKICHNIDDMLLCHRLFLILFVENLNVVNIRGSGQLRSCNSCQSDETSSTAI